MIAASADAVDEAARRPLCAFCAGMTPPPSEPQLVFGVVGSFQLRKAERKWNEVDLRSRRRRRRIVLRWRTIRRARRRMERMERMLFCGEEICCLHLGAENDA